MERTYLLWASGPDRPGIVADLTNILLNHRCNLEDSSMMRLGSEFAIFLIFTSQRALISTKGGHIFSALEKSARLSIGLKEISRREARFRPSGKNAVVITVQGPDRPGIVFHVTRALARRRFNITDLSTHRTGGRPAGYVLFIEGEFPKGGEIKKFEKDLRSLESKLRTRISINSVTPQTI